MEPGGAQVSLAPTSVALTFKAGVANHSGRKVVQVIFSVPGTLGSVTIPFSRISWLNASWISLGFKS